MRLKAATSLDGRTALANGESQWITGPEARLDGHRWRARACAILTGIGTVRDDDPQLTVRGVETLRQPLRVVVDSRLEISPDARVLQGGRVLVVAAIEAPLQASIIEAAGAEVICLANNDGKVDLPALLRELAKRGINELHVEAGFKLNGSLMREGLVDELLLYVAPCLLGDASRGLFNLPELESLEEKRRMRWHELRQVGADLRIMARLI